MKILHNPRCSKSRQTLALIREGGVEPEIVEYLQHPPTEADLHDIVQKLGCSAASLIRRKEALFSELGLKDRVLTESEVISTLSAHPRLIERPIVISGEMAIVGRPPENVLSLL